VEVNKNVVAAECLLEEMTHETWVWCLFIYLSTVAFFWYILSSQL